MAVHRVIINIDGTTIYDANPSTFYCAVTETGLEYGYPGDDYIQWNYSGSGTFLGFADSAGATMAQYENGYTFYAGGAVSGTITLILYSVASSGSAITDLRGTKWLLNETIGFDGSSAFEYLILFGSDGKSFNALNYDPDAPGTDVIIYIGDTEDIEVYTRDDGWTNQSYRTIEITGGTDATNPYAISFIQTNGKQIIEPTGNEYTLTQTLTNLTSGNITLTITPDEGYALPAQADIVVTGGTIVSYDDTTGELVVTAGTTAVEVTCGSAVSTIRFTISGMTYQAEDGMTWAQWCDSAYNTDGYYVDDSTYSIYNMTGEAYVTTILPIGPELAVPSTATVVNGASYSLKSIGGGSN